MLYFNSTMRGPLVVNLVFNSSIIYDYVCDLLHILIGYLISNLFQSDINVKGRCLIGPGPLYITFGCDMPITLLHLMLMSKIYVGSKF